MNPEGRPTLLLFLAGLNVIVAAMFLFTFVGSLVVPEMAHSLRLAALRGGVPPFWVLFRLLAAGVWAGSMSAGLLSRWIWGYVVGILGYSVTMVKSLLGLGFALGGYLTPAEIRQVVVNLGCDSIMSAVAFVALVYLLTPRVMRFYKVSWSRVRVLAGGVSVAILLCVFRQFVLGS